MSAAPDPTKVSNLIARFDQMHIPAPGVSPRMAAPLTPKQASFSPRKMTVKETVREMPDFPPLNSHIETETLKALRDFYGECKARITVKMQKKPLDERRQRWVQSLITRLNDLNALLQQREESLALRMKLTEEARRRIESLRDLQEYKPEVEEIVARLNAADGPRLRELEERLVDINIIVQARPSRSTKVRSTVAQGILDLWRMAGNTILIDDTDELQQIHPTAHNRSTPADEADTQIRFTRLFELFLKHSGDPHSPPDTSGWNLTVCQNWGESLPEEGVEPDRLLSQALFDKVPSTQTVSRLGDLRRTACEDEEDLILSLKDLEEGLKKEPENPLYLYQLGALLRRGRVGHFNKKMERFLRSCIQTLFSGSLTAVDILARAPNTETNKKNLYVTVTPGGVEIQRVFNLNHSSLIIIHLPCEMKVLDGEKRSTTVATFAVSYTITFDSEMTATSLSCKASQAKYV